MVLSYDRSILTIFPTSILEINTEDVYIFVTNHKYQYGKVYLVSFCFLAFFHIKIREIAPFETDLKFRLYCSALHCMITLDSTYLMEVLT